MKNRILSLSILMLASVGIFTKAMAQSATPWPEGKEWALTISAERAGPAGKQLKLLPGYTTKFVILRPFAEMNALIAKMTGKATAVISPEFMNYYMGYEVIGNTIYGKDQESLVWDDELTALASKSKAGILTKNDFRSSRWIHTVNALDLKEKNCLAISVIGGVIGGCGDIWQDGLTSDEVVCHNGFNYLKCQVGCMNTIYNRQADVQQGFCPETK
jgi:hypothetical protein